MPMCPSLKLWFSPLPHRRKVWGPARACGQGDEPSGTTGSVFGPVNRLTFSLQAEPMGFCSAGSFLLQPLSSSTGDSPSSTVLTHVSALRTVQLRAGAGRPSRCPGPRAPGRPEKWVSALCFSGLPLGQPRFLSSTCLPPTLRAGRVSLTTGQCAKEQGWKPVLGGDVVPNLSLRDDVEKQCAHLLSKGTS